LTAGESGSYGIFGKNLEKGGRVSEHGISYHRKYMGGCAPKWEGRPRGETNKKRRGKTRESSGLGEKNTIYLLYGCGE